MIAPQLCAAVLCFVSAAEANITMLRQLQHQLNHSHCSRITWHQAASSCTGLAGCIIFLGSWVGMIT